MCGHDYSFSQAELDAFLDVGLLFQPLHTGGDAMNIMILANITKTQLATATADLKDLCGPNIKVEFSKVSGDKYSIRCTETGMRNKVGVYFDGFMANLKPSQAESEDGIEPDPTKETPVV